MGANAQTKVPTFAAAEVLTAANTNLLSNGIPVFSGTATRNDAFGGSGEKVLAEGQFAYLEDSNTTQFYDGSSWLGLGGKIGQVVSTTKTDSFTTTSTSFVDVTDLSVSITPTATTSKVLVIVNMVGSASPGVVAMFGVLVRDSTQIALGDAASSRTRTTGFLQSANADSVSMMSINFLDSPATVSALTYKMQIAANAASTVAVNRSVTDANSAAYGRTSSTITVLEILA
jgi:hypothetical protein